MTTCDDDKVDRSDPELASAGEDETRDLGQVILIRDPAAAVPARTARADCDPHTALERGLAAYIAGLSWAHAGKPIAFARVLAGFPEPDDRGPEDRATAVVHSEEEGIYAGVPQNYTPKREDQVGNVAGDGLATFVVNAGTYELSRLSITVVCGSKEERVGVRVMLERALRPVEWSPGFRLSLPNYHNAIAVYTMLSAAQPDGEDTAAANAWPLVIYLRAAVPSFVVHELPLAKPRSKGTIVTP